MLIRTLVFLAVVFSGCSVQGSGNFFRESDVLQKFVREIHTRIPDSSDPIPVSGVFPADALRFQSLVWKGSAWSHRLFLRGEPQSSSGFCVLYLGGSGAAREEIRLAETVSAHAGVPSFVLMDLPNQPLFNGLKESALVAYTLKQYRESGDRSWPILFPMVAGATRAMDFIQRISAFKCRKFVIGGSSKRAWTAWLAAAIDERVAAIVPASFDMLNFPLQVRHSKDTYGGESKELADYAKNGLFDDLDDPAVKRLVAWLDPFSYVARLDQPKLIVSGTNDPYWMIDSLDAFVPRLIGDNYILRVPNGDHHILSLSEVQMAIASWIKLLVSGRLPQVNSKFNGDFGVGGELEVRADRPITEARLWCADSESRDFRRAVWGSQAVALSNQSSFRVPLKAPDTGFRACYLEVLPESNEGRNTPGFSLSAPLLGHN